MQRVGHSRWRLLPLAGGAVMATVLLAIDPLVAGAPWWTYPAADFWFALLLALLPWVACAGLAAWQGFERATRLGILLMALISWAAAIIPSALWTLLLDDVFPSAGTMSISMNLALSAGALAVPLSLVVLLRRLARRTGGPRPELGA